MKKITILLSLIITSSIFAQSLQMPNIPAEGVNYETRTLDDVIFISDQGPWDFTQYNNLPDQSVISMQSIDDSPYSSSNYPNTTHVKYGTSGSQSVIQFPGFTSSGYTVGSLEPDIPVSFTFADYKAGIDASLSSIISIESSN